MIKYLFSVFITLFFISCSTQEPAPSKQPLFNEAVSSEGYSYQEDIYIFFALRAEELGDFKSASSIFYKLYKDTDKNEYIYRTLQNDLSSKNYLNVIKKVDLLDNIIKSEFIIKRYKILSLMSLKRFNEAEILAVTLLEETKAVDDYILLADIYIYKKEFTKSLECLENAYKIDYHERVIDKISLILYLNLERKKEAIKRLEAHSSVQGNSLLISKRLVNLYSSENDVDGLLSSLLRVYELNKNLEVAKKIIQIYSYKKEYTKLMVFLETSQSNDKVLLELYSTSKNYLKAFPLAFRIYFDTGDVNYLGQSAIYEYESSEDKNNIEMLNGVIEKLESLLTQNETPLYFNYLGYLLIEHSIDVEKGIDYVQNALKEDPKSAYYLDSLAWGYYKLGECKRAKEIMNRVVELDGSDNEEVLLHIKSIDKCIKN